MNYIHLEGRAGDKLANVGYVVLDGVKLSSNPWHTPGEGHPALPEGVPVFPVMRELATFSVSKRLTKSRSRIVREIRAILGDFPDSRIVKVTVRESKITLRRKTQ